MAAVTIHAPADFTDEDAAAIKAVAAGTASPGQQKTALLWIMDEACGTWRDSLDPNRDSVTFYMNGRKSVALMIAAVLRSRPNKKDSK